MRRRRRNPAGLPLVWMIGSALVTAGGIAFALLRKHPAQQLSNGMQFDPNDKPGFVGLSDDQFRQIPAPSPSDGPMFVVADVRGLPFQVPGVHDGTVIFEIVAAPDLAARTILAVSKDDRFPDVTPRAIPQSAITGLAA